VALADVASPGVSTRTVIKPEYTPAEVEANSVDLSEVLRSDVDVEDVVRDDAIVNLAWGGGRHTTTGADTYGEGLSFPVTPAEDTPEGAGQGAVQYEILIGGRNNTRPISFLEQGKHLASAVGMIVIPGVGFGTGFLVADDLVMTNNHVLRSAEVAEGSHILFDFENRLDGSLRRTAKTKLASRAGFWTSPAPPLGEPLSEGCLDYTIVRLERTAPGTRVPLRLGSFEIACLDDVVVIHHPGGAPKQITISGTEVQFVDTLRCQYLADTQTGSSGAPVFNDKWELVALHHIGGVSQPDAPNTKRNEGVCVDAILKSLPDSLMTEIRRG
jgi:Trypsin-like peptidase domain